MKNKKLTYLLGLLVLSVWALIFYKVYKVISNNDESVIAKEHVTVKEVLNDYALKKDTTHLLLNYRDPFSAPKPEPVEIPVSQLVHKPALPTVQKPPVNWGAIKYSGFIHNPGSKKLIAMISINGKELMLSEGETAEQIKLVKNMKDSVKIIYQGNTKFITLNNKSQ
jgi:hypothetical protein